MDYNKNKYPALVIIIDSLHAGYVITRASLVLFFEPLYHGRDHDQSKGSHLWPEG